MRNDSKTPNIILFLTDDHGAWANGCYGNGEVQTPTLDALAARGSRFANAFTPTPVCSPARACLMTGCTASQVGIHDWLQEDESEIAERDWLAGQKTLFQYLHEAGYATALCGKWHMGQSHLRPRGVDFHFGLHHGQGQHNQEYMYVKNGQPLTLSGNKSGFITDYALEFLDQAPADRPFFLNIGYIATHSPYGQQHHDPAVTSQYQNAKFTDIPHYSTHPWVKNEDGPGDSPTREALRDRYIGYYAAVTEIDNNVRRVIDKLEAMGQSDNTIIIYTSDHGCTLGHHGFWGKGNSTRPLNMHEYSLRIPLIWHHPGYVSGQVVEACVDHYDTFATILNMAGVTLGDAYRYPGSSYLPMLQGYSQPWQDTRFGEYGDLRMIRTPRWKLVYRYPSGPHDLFDLEHDPAESTNLANKGATQVVIQELKSQLDDFYAKFQAPEKSGLKVKELPQHNLNAEAWRDGRREARGLQRY